ncbi:GGDEF domain-containing protein [Geminicoccaceae bacterium 1502E]|nr:GGDEF domain-containing protein [Geminicoccaceae bacterium 1502E]
MKFLPPALLCLFAATFLCVWMMDRGRRHTLLFSVAFLSYGVAALAQTALWPPDLGTNAVITAALYVAASLLLVESLLMRSGRSLSPIHHGGALVGLVGAIWYFYYVDRDLVARIHVLNLGIGCIFLCGAWKLRFLVRGSSTDRALFWLLLVLAVHFFPRTLLTASSVSEALDGGLAAFASSAFWGWIQFSMSVLGVGLGLGLLAVTGADAIRALERERDRDPLTGMLNRRGLEARLRTMLRRPAPPAVSVIVCDIDHFKKINDTFGHLAGDRVLAAVAKTIMRTARAGDLAGRIGGEEFLVVLKDEPVELALAFTERLRAAIEQERFDCVPPSSAVTCSFGIAVLRQGEELWAAVDRADRLLYAAKDAGRNRAFAEGVHMLRVA